MTKFDIGDSIYLFHITLAAFWITLIQDPAYPYQLHFVHHCPSHPLHQSVLRAHNTRVQMDPSLVFVKIYVHCMVADDLRISYPPWKQCCTVPTFPTSSQDSHILSSTSPHDFPMESYIAPTLSLSPYSYGFSGRNLPFICGQEPSDT
jgi:hypothetical protein